AGGGLSYTENDAATPVAPALSITDPDNTNLASATVSITSGFVSGQDVLAATTVGTSIVASYNSSTGVLTLSGSDTLAHYQAVLQSVTYFNSSENPNTIPRTISFVVNDGTANSNTANRNISVTSVNDAPMIDSVSITPSSPTTNQILMANVTSHDVDG